MVVMPAAHCLTLLSPPSYCAKRYKKTICKKALTHSPHHQQYLIFQLWHSGWVWQEPIATSDRWRFVVERWFNTQGIHHAWVKLQITYRKREKSKGGKDIFMFDTSRVRIWTFTNDDLFFVLFHLNLRIINILQDWNLMISQCWFIIRCNTAAHRIQSMLCSNTCITSKALALYK